MLQRFNAVRQSVLALLRARRFSAEVVQVKEGSFPKGVLRDYFERNVTGPGIWKWDQYFPVYERHLSRFRGRSVNVLEIGIYAGGSLAMWRQYFGEGCHVYGVDIEPACRKYESDNVTIHIGDQADRTFWRSLDLPPIDIVIDDGGHLADQMIATFEELLPRMSEESVYIVEDIHGPGHAFLGYLYGLIRQLNGAAFRPTPEPSVTSSPLQRRVNGIHVYPFVTAIELSPAPAVFHCSKRGTDWQPF